MGTILQAAAVHLALKSDFDSLDPKVFLSQLRDIMKKQENTIYPGSVTRIYLLQMVFVILTCLG